MKTVLSLQELPEDPTAFGRSYASSISVFCTGSNASGASFICHDDPPR